MNYKQQVLFLNDVTAWRAHIPALITMDIIKSPFLHQCRFHSNGYDFKIVQKSFIQSSRSKPPWLLMSTNLTLLDILKHDTNDPIVQSEEPFFRVQRIIDEEFHINSLECDPGKRFQIKE